MPATDAHPPADVLLAFHCGQLRGPDADAVEQHLAECNECADRLLTQPDDSLLQLVRGARCQPVNEHTGVPEKAAAQLDTAVTVTVGPGRTPHPDPAPATRLDDIPPELIGHPRYRVLEVLGRGGMGAVYLAEHVKMGRKVALKVIRPALLASGTALPRFRQEVKAAARLSHPNIVQAYDADEADDLHFLVMEFVDGTDLAHLLKSRGGLLPVPLACECARQAALGLQHAHEQGMVHRDIKPHNLMVTADGRVKILDFGLAGFSRDPNGEESPQLTGAGTVMGTADYIAPEQTRDAHSVDIRADIYSLGCTLYQLLAGRVPFDSGSVVEKMVKHAVDVPPPLVELRPDLPGVLVRVVERMMAKRPEDRFPTPAAVAEALAPFAVAHPAAPRETRRKRRFSRALVAGLFALFALVAAAGVVYRIQTDNGEIVITTESDDVEVTVRKGGKTVEILDTKTKKKLTLPTGDYDLTLSGPDGFTLSTDKVTIRRGKEALVTVERVRKPEPKPELTPPLKPLSGKFELIRTFDSPTGRDLWQPVFSPDNRYIAVALNTGNGSNRSSRLLVWEVASGKLVREIASPTGGWFCTYGLRAGGRIVGAFGAAADDGAYEFRVWDVATGKEERAPDKVERWPAHMSASRDGKYVAHSLVLPGDVVDGLRLCDVGSGKTVATLEPLRHKSLCGTSHFTPDGNYLVTADSLPDRDGQPQCELRWTATATGRVDRRLTVGGRFVREHLGFADGGRTLVVIRYEKATGHAAEFLDTETGKSLRTQRFGPTEGLNGVRLSPDGRLGVLLNLDKTVRVYDLSDGRELGVVQLHLLGNADVIVSPSSELLALSSREGFSVFRLPGAAPHLLPNPAPAPHQPADGVAPLPDKPGLIRTIPRLSPDFSYFPQFSSDSRMVMVARKIREGLSVDSFRVSEVATGRVVRDLDMPGVRMTAAEFTPDGKSVLSACVAGNGTFRYHLWNLATGEARDQPQIGLVGGWPCHFAFSPDGTRFLAKLVPDADGPLWYEVRDLATGERLAQLGPIPDRGRYFMYSCFTPDGKSVVSTVTFDLPADKPQAERTELWVTKLDGSAPKKYPAGVAVTFWYPFIDAVTGEVACCAQSAGVENRYWIQYWHPETGKLARKLECPPGKVGSYSSSANGTRFVMTQEDKQGRWNGLVFDREGKEVYGVPATDKLGAILSPDGRALATYDNTEATLYRLPDAGGK